MFHLIKHTRPDVVILTETRADVRESISKIWPGAKTEQALPVGTPARAGVALITKPGREVRPRGSWSITGENDNGLTQGVRCSISGDVSIAGVYISPQSKELQTANLLERVTGDEKNHRNIVVGDMNARHRS